MEEQDRMMLERDALADARRALTRVRIKLPHLSGLASVVELRVNNAVCGTACVSGTGLLMINSSWFSSIDDDDATFVMAHELMHLALDHHARTSEDSNPEEVNMAADYIVNDMLAESMECQPPAGALHEPGSRKLSMEQILINLRREEANRGINPMSNAFESLGHDEFPPVLVEDLIDEKTEEKLYPEESSQRIRRKGLIAKKVREIDTLKETLERVEAAVSKGAEACKGSGAGNEKAILAAAASKYRPPWELALQASLEDCRPPERTYRRPSRRNSGYDANIVLPGRMRIPSWTLVIVLDTSGSMTYLLPRVLGIIGVFCKENNVDKIRILQCDSDLHKDEWVTPDELMEFEIEGFGGSDMSSAMEKLHKDSSVEAAVVITDGDIDYPREPVNYQVIWAIIGRDGGFWGFDDGPFTPPYGRVITIEESDSSN